MSPQASGETVSWSIETVENVNNAFSYDVAFDAQGHAHMIYVDLSTINIMYATNATGAWVNQTVGGDFNNYAINCAIDADGKMHFSYYNDNQHLGYGTNADGTWQFTEVDTSAYSGANNDIAVDAGGNVHIVYSREPDDDHRHLMYAHNMGGDWTIETADSTYYNRGDNCHLALDSNGKAHISYNDYWRNCITYVTNVNGIWERTPLNGGAATNYYNDIALDSNNEVHIIYTNAVDRNPLYATNAGGGWTYATIDAGQKTGYGVAIAIDPSDVVHLNFFSWDDKTLYYSNNEGGSFTAKQPVIGVELGYLRTFANGDEVLTFFYDGITMVMYMARSGDVPTWAPSLDNAPADGQETVAYEFEPQFNETVTGIAAITDAPFLSWNGTAFIGTPGSDDAGTYYINVTATSEAGTLSAYHNATFVIKDTWGPSFTNAPADGQETVTYGYEPALNESYTVTAYSTNADFLSWVGNMYLGTPGSSDAGEYWINVTVRSNAGLLNTTLNETFIIKDTWAPVPTASPLDGQETAYYEFRPEFNDTSAVIVNMETNASFLELVFDDGKGFDLNGFYFAGTPGENDAGEYWINVTAFSDDGLLYCYLNETFVIEDAYANHITNSPGDGRETVDYLFVPQFDGAMTLIDWHSDADWMLLYGPSIKGPGFPNYWYGTPEIGDAGTYYLNITLQSIGGLLYTTHNFTFAVNVSWGPSFDNTPGDGRVTVPYVYEPMFNETDAEITAQDTNALFLIWNGSAFAGTPGLEDDGTYWINITVRSPSGLLETFSNQSFQILPMPRSLRINNDADMLAAVDEYQWAGDGSENDPFIVTGLIIDSLELEENSLFIGNVTYSFVVTGNDLGNAGAAGTWPDARSASLYIYNCDGASITENRLWGSLFGLFLMQCSSISVDDNLVELNDYAGIAVLSDCQLISIENNTVDGNEMMYGIWIKGAAYVRMANNTLSNASNAAVVEDDGTTSPSHIIFRDNDVHHVLNGLMLSNVLGAVVRNNTFADVDQDMSDAAIVIYNGQSMDVSGNTIADGVRGIYLYESSYIRMENNSISVIYTGVDMFSVTSSYLGNGTIIAATGVLTNECYLCELRGLDISDGDIGVLINALSDRITVADCTFARLGLGLKVAWALDTTVLNCTFETTEGVRNDYSDHTIVADCAFNWTARSVYAYSSHWLTVIDNTMTNYAQGIVMDTITESLISGNTLYYGQGDIVLTMCMDTVLDGNVIFGSRQTSSGISLVACTSMTLYSNAIEDGAITFDVNYGWETVDTHTIAENNTVGGKPVYYYRSADHAGLETPDDGGQIIIASVSNLIVTGLQTTSCTVPVQIYNSDSIDLRNLYLVGMGVGVSMIDSSDIRIESSTIINMSMGILGRYVSQVYIGHSHFVGNIDGVNMNSLMGRCDNVTVEHNLMENNHRYGVVFDGVDDSRIAHNVIANSTSYGARIMATYNVTMVENLFYRNNGVGDTYSVPPFQALADAPGDHLYVDGRGNYWSEQLGPDADGDGVVDYFIYELAGGMNYDMYPLAFVFLSEPDTDGRNRTAYFYDADVDQEAEFELITDAGFLSIDGDGNITGVPDACGMFSVSVKATLIGYLVIWQNYTLVIDETWAPEISGMPATGKETVEYSFQPLVNESDAIIAADTDAPFLSWNGTAFVGAPSVNDAGTYWINITATSVDGLLTGWYNGTFVVEDSWTPLITSAPQDGQETAYFEYRPSFNETVDLVSALTNAPFLEWHDVNEKDVQGDWYCSGTPGQNDAGEYWINVTVRSADGLLVTWQNATFVIGDSWAPAFENTPKDGQETVEHVYEPRFNESATITGFETNAPFLSWNGSAYVGTPTVNDAGEYWINITAMSDDGLLESWQNTTFVIGDSWAPTFENAPVNGQETLEYAYGPLFNETVMIIGHATNAPFLSWNGSAFVGTPTGDDAGTYWINVTALSTAGLLEKHLNSTFVIGDSWAPQIESGAVDTGRETLEYAYSPEANETVEWHLSTDAPFLSWNGSAVVGLPNVTSSGTYYVNLTATSADGLLAAWQNYTLVIDDTWAAELTNGPSGGQETVTYVFRPTFNETVTVTGHATNAPFLSWNGTAFVGTPTVADAGEYWMSITADSVPGLLSASWNLTLVIGEAWAPEIVSEPPMSDLWATLGYIYQLEANESVVFALSTNAGFLALADDVISGTMEAGTFYVNVTATSVNGLLSSWQNFTLTVGTDASAPNVEIISPADGALLNDTQVTVVWNVTDDGSGIAGIWIGADDGNWTAVSGTSTTLDLIGGEHNITIRSVDAVGNVAYGNITVLIDLVAPTVSSAVPQGDDVAVNAPLVITFSEAMDVGSVTVTVNGQPAALAWNGSVATVAGDWAYDTEHTIVVAGQDLAGNAMEAMTFSFVTEEQLVTVSGILLDDEGNPVANATISVNGTIVGVTGDDGSYSFLLTPGDHLVAISAEGYEGQTLSLTVGDEPASLEVEMHGTHEASDGSLWWLALVMIAIIIGLLYMIRRQF